MESIQIRIQEETHGGIVVYVNVSDLDNIDMIWSDKNQEVKDRQEWMQEGLIFSSKSSIQTGYK